MSFTSFPFLGTSLGQIVIGPDGNFWITAPGAGVSKLTPLGVITTYPLGPNVQYGICVGADSRLWIGAGTDGFYAITTAGVSTNYPVSGIAYLGIGNVTLGSDGRVWGSWTGWDMVSAVDTSGTVTSYGPYSNYSIFGIAGGPGGYVYADYAEYPFGLIQIDPSTGTGTTLTP